MMSPHPPTEVEVQSNIPLLKKVKTVSLVEHPQILIKLGERAPAKAPPFLPCDIWRVEKNGTGKRTLLSLKRKFYFCSLRFCALNDTFAGVKFLLQCG